jgi:hypothetical protein
LCVCKQHFLFFREDIESLRIKSCIIYDYKLKKNDLIPVLTRAEYLCMCMDKQVMKQCGGCNLKTLTHTCNFGDLLNIYIYFPHLLADTDILIQLIEHYFEKHWKQTLKSYVEQYLRDQCLSYSFLTICMCEFHCLDTLLRNLNLLLFPGFCTYLKSLYS